MSIRQRKTVSGKMRYDATIKRNYVTRHLGTFDTRAEAEQAYSNYVIGQRIDSRHDTIKRAASIIGVDAVNLLYRHGLCVRTQNKPTRSQPTRQPKGGLDDTGPDTRPRSTE